MKSSNLRACVNTTNYSNAIFGILKRTNLICIWITYVIAAFVHWLSSPSMNGIQRGPGLSYRRPLLGCVVTRGGWIDGRTSVRYRLGGWGDERWKTLLMPRDRGRLVPFVAILLKDSFSYVVYACCFACCVVYNRRRRLSNESKPKYINQLNAKTPTADELNCYSWNERIKYCVHTLNILMKKPLVWRFDSPSKKHLKLV